MEEEEARIAAEVARLAAQQEEREREAMAVQDARLREQLEQERRDHELALRLAQESNGQVEELQTSLRS